MWEVEESLGASSLENGVKKRLATASSAVLGLCQKQPVALQRPFAETVYCQPVVANVRQQQRILKIKAVKGKLMLSFQEFMGLDPHLQYYSG